MKNATRTFLKIQIVLAKIFYSIQKINKKVSKVYGTRTKFIKSKIQTCTIGVPIRFFTLKVYVYSNFSDISPQHDSSRTVTISLPYNNRILSNRNPAFSIDFKIIYFYSRRLCPILSLLLSFAFPSRCHSFTVPLLHRFKGKAFRSFLKSNPPITVLKRSFSFLDD